MKSRVVPLIVIGGLIFESELGLGLESFPYHAIDEEVSFLSYAEFPPETSNIVRRIFLMTRSLRNFCGIPDTEVWNSTPSLEQNGFPEVLEGDRTDLAKRIPVLLSEVDKLITWTGADKDTSLTWLKTLTD